jgi:hypothetical protein
VQISGQAEQPRVLLLSVPYALKAADAETIGGLPPSAFMKATPAEQAGANAAGTSAAAANGVGASAANGASNAAHPDLAGSGKKDYIPLWTAAATLGDSVLFQSTSPGTSGDIGMGTITPAGPLHIVGPASAPPSSQPAANNGLILGTNGTASYKWIQSFGGPLTLNPIGNNVGIGTSTPGQLLDVAGSASIDSTGKNNGTFANNLTFGAGGEGISSTRVSTGTNPFGLDFWTDFARRISVTQSGNVGIGTATPSYQFQVSSSSARNAEIAMVSGGTDAAISVNNTATGGREYWIDSGSGSAGIGAGNFAVYDHTAGATRLAISSSGNVGIGTTSPTHLLEVAGNADVDSTDLNNGTNGIDLTFGHASGEGISSPRTTGSTNMFGLDFWTAGTLHMCIANNGNVGIGVCPASHPLQMGDGAYEQSGTWTNASDRNLKANFTPVNGRLLLAHLNKIPISTWNYKTDDRSVRHLGPMAQDFYAAFGLDGKDEKHISTVDEGGVALAAVQELYRMVLKGDAQVASLARSNREKDVQIENLKAEVKQLHQLEQAVQVLSTKLSKIEAGENTSANLLRASK